VYFNSEHRYLPALRRGCKEPQVEIHPDTAKKHGIGRGDWVRISTPHGSIRQRAHLNEDIHPGLIDCQFGWWFPEREGWEHGIWESNANVLTSQAGPYDPAMGSYQLRALLCRIDKA
jgi:anaerobic selenocysteine-containing dehydrogenase